MACWAAIKEHLWGNTVGGMDVFFVSKGLFSLIKLCVCVRACVC